ncbi:hypothetical protein CL684_01820 [Candidatus Campbellbacteria bacterium]|nr:hypothetical protein [Candidatus Campbellbacteria bacterium]|tara:strand:- start:10710 stop:11426 length:717 start_codon:yes stop_codon:yes gene_type:complete
MKLQKKSFHQGFSLVEILITIAIVGVLATIGLNIFGDQNFRAKNASMVQTLSGVSNLIDFTKYPASLETLCDEFEPGEEFGYIRTTIEDNGGIWHCDSTEGEYRIFVKLNQEATLARLDMGDITNIAFAQEESQLHEFGNYYCINSNFDRNFTHWSANNLEFPSCDDSTYSPVPEDPAPTPEPTPDPEPESDPEPPLEHGGPVCNAPKEQVCHFGKTLCVSSKAVKAHTKHGDTEGIC